MRRALTIAFAFAASACTGAVEHQPEPISDVDLAAYHQEAYADFTRRRRAFDASDGLSEAEARLLADEYFVETFGLCGGVYQVTDGGGQWLAWARVGYAGDPVAEPIRVNKISGVVSHPDAVDRTYSQILRAAEERYSANLSRFAPDAPLSQAPR